MKQTTESSQKPQSNEKIRIAGIVDDSTVDGPGIRYTIFMQGCPHNCPGCHNPATHDYSGGYEATFDDILDDLKGYKYIKGVTFSGGEPLAQTEALRALTDRLKNADYHIIIYTGYTYEEIAADKTMFAAISHADLLIDGPYLQAKRTLSLPFRGSSNQRILDIRQSIQHGGAVVADNYTRIDI